MTDYLKNIAENLGITEEEAKARVRELVDSGELTLGAVMSAKRERIGVLPETPWEQIRKTPKPPKSLDWKQTEGWYRDHAHEVWRGTEGWTWYVLKSYQKDRTQPQARCFCLVDGFESELGDVYWSDILEHARRVR